MVPRGILITGATGTVGRKYIAARGGCRPVVQVPVPGRIVAGYRAGVNLVPDRAVGTTEFADYLAEKQIKFAHLSASP